MDSNKESEIDEILEKITAKIVLEDEEGEPLKTRIMWKKGKKEMC